MTGSIHSPRAPYASKPMDYEHQDIGFLEVVVAVRAVSANLVKALGAEDYKFMRHEDPRALATDVVTLSGFDSFGAASEAVHAIADWSTRWGHKRGLIASNRLPSSPPCVLDKATSTEDYAGVDSCALSAETIERGLAETNSVGTGGLWCTRSEGGRGLLLHRDSFDLSNPSVRSEQRKHSGKDSRIWRFIHRGSDKDFKEEEGELSDDDANVERWRTVSEARDTILLQNHHHHRSESKGSASQQAVKAMPWLPFAGFMSKSEAIKVLPRGRSTSGRSPVGVNVASRWEARSFTPPKVRASDTGKYHELGEDAVGSGSRKDKEEDMKSWSPRSAGETRSPAASPSREIRESSEVAKPALLEILERAATGRNSNANLVGCVEHNSSS